MRRELLLVFLSPLLLIVIGMGVLMIVRDRGRLPERAPGEQLYREVLELVREGYVTEIELEELIYGAARGIVSQLDDHCRVYDGEEWREQRTAAEGKYAGVGMVVGRLRQHLAIIDVTSGGPADEAGLAPGDRILAVEGEVVPPGAQLTDEFLSRLRGEPGSELELVIGPAGDEGQRRSVQVVRELVDQRTVFGRILDPEIGLGYVWLTHFRENTAAYFGHELEALRQGGLRSLILDLRGNRGGGLDVAVEIADRFLDSGVIVSTVGRTSSHGHVAKPPSPEGDLPLVVLVDARSASAAEVLAGALQDHSRAVLVGERTYGKGVVQAIVPFSSRPGGLKITTAHYFTPAGRCIEKQVALPDGQERRGGLVPDVHVPVSERVRARSDSLRERTRYRPFIRKILAEEDDIPEDFADPQLEVAAALLRGERAPDRVLAEAH